MKNYRIQLASNYQVIEFSIELEEEAVLTVDHPEVASAIEFINEVGKLVEQHVKNPARAKAQAKPQSQRKSSSTNGKVEMASERQLDFLEGLGYDGEDGWELTKEEANKKIRELQGK